MYRTVFDLVAKKKFINYKYNVHKKSRGIKL